MTDTSIRCCRHLVHVSYSHASSCCRRFSLVNVVVSVTFGEKGGHGQFRGQAGHKRVWLHLQMGVLALSYQYICLHL